MTGSCRTRAPLLGVVAVVLLMVGNELTKVGGDSPALPASAEEYARSIGSSPLVVVGAFVVIAAWLAMAGFFTAVAERLCERPDGEYPARLVAGGGVLAAAVGICGGLPLLAAALMTRDGDLSPEVAKALLLMNAAVFVVDWLLLAVPIAVASVSGRHTGVLGRWLGWSGAAVATGLAVSSLAVWWVDGLLAVWLLALVWIAATGIALARRGRRNGSAAAGTEVPSRVTSAAAS